MTDRPKDTSDSAEQTFLATASHEIRTPLNGILGTVSLLLESDLRPAQREYAEAIRQSGTRLLELLNNVLDYARLDANALELEATAFSPEALAREVVELLAPRAHAAGLDIAIRHVQPHDAIVTADSGRIRQILFNLVGNALKFTTEGGVLIDVNVFDDAVEWTITDTGPGIATADKDRLFEAFRQSSASDAQKDGGVGLGLAIVKRLSQVLGGEIEVFGAPGCGTAFRFRLPVASTPRPGTRLAALPAKVALVGLPPPSALSVSATLFHAGAGITVAAPGARLRDVDVILAGADLPSAEIARLAAMAPTLVVLRPEDRSAITRFRLLGCSGWLIRPLRPGSLVERIGLAKAGTRVFSDDLAPEKTAGQRVLVADDNAINALVAQRALEKAGFMVTLVGTGVEALEAAEKTEFALILMDLRMPVMDGFEAMRSLRGRGCSVPICAISAEVNPDIEARALSAGANVVAAKPLDAEALRGLAGQWAKTSAARGAA